MVMEANDNKLSYELKKLRKSKDLTQAEISEETGLSVRTISNIENNKYATIQDVLTYCDALGYTVELKKKKTPTVIVIRVNPTDIHDCEE